MRGDAATRLQASEDVFYALANVVGIDGEVRGTTPLTLGLTSGSHEVQVGDGDGAGRRTIEVARRDGARFVWQGGEWQVFY